MSQIPPDVANGVAELIRNLCNKENGYNYVTHMTIGDYNYKITMTLQDVDPVKEARIASIIIKRMDK